MSKNMIPENKMGSDPVGPLLFLMSLPLMCSMVMEALYNVVDSLFVARLGEEALAALSLAFPIQLAVVSVTVGTGVGINALLSRQLGERDCAGADRTAMNGVFLALLTYIFFLAAGLFFVGPYFTSQTNDAEICGMGVDYLSICLVWSFGGVGQITFQRLLQSTGRTALSMVSQLIGAAINIVMDPILIFGLCGAPVMGVRGAAWATVLGQIAALAIAVFFNLKMNPDITLRIAGFRPNARIISRIYSIGAPAIVMQLLNSLMAFGVNFILIDISSTAVAAFGIYIKVQNFVFMPVFGLNNAVIAVAAYNYGAGDRLRVEQSVKYGMLFAAAIMLCGTAAVQGLAEPILSLFEATPKLLAIGIPAMRIISLSYIFTAYMLIAQGAYQALGNGVYSLAVTLLRVVIVLLPLLWIFAAFFPVSCVWWAFVVSEVISTAVSAFLLKKIYREKVETMGALRPHAA